MTKKYDEALKLIKESSEKDDSLFMKAALAFYDGLKESVEEWQKGKYPNIAVFEVEIYSLFQSRVQTYINATVEVINHIVNQAQRDIAELQMRADMGGDAGYILKESQFRQKKMELSMDQAYKRLGEIFKANYQLLSFVDYLDKEMNSKRAIPPMILVMFGMDKLNLYGSKMRREYIKDTALLVKYETILKTFDNAISKCEKQIINTQNELYWEENISLKEKYESELKSSNEVINRCKPIYDDYNKKQTSGIKNLREERDKKIEEELECDKLESDIASLEYQLRKCSIFQGKKKKELQSQITSNREVFENMKVKAKKARQDWNKLYNEKIDEIKNYKPDEVNEYFDAIKQRDTIMGIFNSQQGEDSKLLKDFKKALKAVQDTKATLTTKYQRGEC